MVYSATGSSDLFFIIGCLTSNLLVLGLFQLAFFLCGELISASLLDKIRPLSLLPGSVMNRVRYQKPIRKSKNCEVDED